MKQKNNKSFPYPLLCSDTDDFVNSYFCHRITNRHTNTEIIIHLEAETDNTGLIHLIESGEAVCVYHIECPTTGFRKIIKTGLVPRNETIPFAKLRGSLEINTFIVAAVHISNYKNDNFNEDYEGLTFDIEQGCRLAEADIYELEIPKKYTDFLEKNDPYVIVLPDKDNPDCKNARIDVYGQKILMFVPETASTNYKALQQTVAIRPVLYTMYIIPAIYQGLLFLKTAEETEFIDAKNLLWVQSMEDELKEDFQISLESIRDKTLTELYEIAQQLVGNSLLPASKYLLGRKEEDMPDED